MAADIARKLASIWLIVLVVVPATIEFPDKLGICGKPGITGPQSRRNRHRLKLAGRCCHLGPILKPSGKI